MICVTGAGGTVGGEVLRQLEASGMPLRAAYYSQAKVAAARDHGRDAAAIDYRRPDTLEAAFADCERLFLVGPNVPDQTRLELNAVGAARAAGVRQIVKLSVFGAEGADYSLARVHRPVEQAIESSGIAYTFLRPNSFMQNAANFMAPSIRSDSVLYSASGQARVGYIDVRDIAAVAVAALAGSDHGGQAYTLTGPEALSYDELAETISAVLGRPIRHVDLDPAELERGMLAADMPPTIVEWLLDLERYVREGHAARLTGAVRELTGREPLRFADYLRETAATGVWDDDGH